MNLENRTLLFLEDNIVFAKTIIEFLEIYFETVLHSTNIKDALNTFEMYKIDAIISDIKVEDGSGLDFITKVREIDKNVQIIVLSAHKDEAFLFKAIPLSIMAYELKPLSYQKFMILLEKLDDSFKKYTTASLIQDLDYNYEKKELILELESIRLSKKESLFIELLLKNRDTLVTYAQIQRYVWENKPISNAAIKNLILRLRKKVNSDFIITVYGFGYQLKI